MKNHRRASITVSRSALQHNFSRVRDLASEAAIMSVIKADAYGHDMLMVAKVLNEVMSAGDEFAVTGVDDVYRLRSQGIDSPITMLSSRFTTDELNGMSANKVRPVIYDSQQLESVTNLDSSAELDIWLKVDSGMGRLGFSLEDAPLIAARLMSNKGVRSVSAMTHLSSADDIDQPCTNRQIKQFINFTQDFDFKKISILNSAGIVGFSEHAHDLVRPGVMLYGVSPQKGRSAESLDLQAVMEFKAELISVKRLPAGSAIGYGRHYTLDCDSKIGVIACGYADGYPRHAVNGTPVIINGMIVPIIGRVSMDLITVDLGDVAAEVGDMALLWGAQNPIENIAASAGTIAYELLCGITARVERIVI